MTWLHPLERRLRKLEQPSRAADRMKAAGIGGRLYRREPGAERELEALAPAEREVALCMYYALVGSEDPFTDVIAHLAADAQRAALDSDRDLYM